KGPEGDARPGAVPEQEEGGQGDAGRRPHGRHLFGHEGHRQADLGGAEIGRGQEGHLHRIEGHSGGENGLLGRTTRDVLRVLGSRLRRRHEAVRVLATGGSHAGDPCETTFREVVRRGPASRFSTNLTTIFVVWVQYKSENRNPATAAGGNRRRPVP